MVASLVEELHGCVAVAVLYADDYVQTRLRVSGLEVADLRNRENALFIYIYFGATGKQQLIVTNGITQNLFDSWYCASVNLCQRRLAYQLANNMASVPVR